MLPTLFIMPKISGACFSIIGASERQWAFVMRLNFSINWGAAGNVTLFSEQQLMDCSWKFGNNACDGGFLFTSSQMVL